MAGLFFFFSVRDNLRLLGWRVGGWAGLCKAGGHVTATLQEKVAVVTGASRGAGRAIALVLGEAGATVFVKGRTVRGAPAVDGLSGTIEETADEVTARGGRGVAVRCDHTVDQD